MCVLEIDVISKIQPETFETQGKSVDMYTFIVFLVILNVLASHNIKFEDKIYHFNTTTLCNAIMVWGINVEK